MGEAHVIDCPDLRAHDLRLMLQEQDPGADIGDPQAEAILAVTGGEPRLVRACLEAC